MPTWNRTPCRPVGNMPMYWIVSGLKCQGNEGELGRKRGGEEREREAYWDASDGHQRASVIFSSLGGPLPTFSSPSLLSFFLSLSFLFPLSILVNIPNQMAEPYWLATGTVWHVPNHLVRASLAKHVVRC